MVLFVDVVYQPLIEVDTHTSLYDQCRVSPAVVVKQHIYHFSLQDFKITSQELNINFTVDRSSQFPPVKDDGSQPWSGAPAAPPRPPSGSSPASPPSPPGDYGVSAPAPPQTGQSPSQTPADTETSGGSETKENTGLDVTLLVFIIIIAVLILAVMVILLVYWCCRPGRQQEREEERQQINNIEKTAGELEREVSRAGLGLVGVEQTVARLEQRVENSSAGQQTADKTQVQSGALSLVQTPDQ